MGCATSLVKYILFLFNFIFVVGGIALVTLGALTYSTFEEYEDLTQELGFAFRGPPIAMMIGGAIVFFIAFMGCCGAIRESHFMMSTYGTILTILLILEVGAIIAATYYKDEVRDAVQNGFAASMKNYGDESSDLSKEQTATWDSMQERIKCCGTTDYKEWIHIDKKVPSSCCKDPINTETCPKEGISVPVNEQLIYTDGCVKKVVDEIGIPTLIIIAGSVAGVELLGIIFACCLAARFRHKGYRA